MLSLIIGGLLLLAVSLNAKQHRRGDGLSQPRFDVASVKRSASDASPMLRALPDRLDAVSVPLSTMLGMAIAVRCCSGCPLLMCCRRARPNASRAARSVAPHSLQLATNQSAV
jgi:hypothetical protein